MTRLFAIVAALALGGCASYDRSHIQTFTGSYDRSDDVYSFGYSITPIAPVKGYAK